MTRPHLSEAMKDGAWAGRRAFVVGGGPSLQDTKFDFSRLAGENWIGCNMAFRFAPPIAITICYRFMRDIIQGRVDLHEEWNAAPGLKVYLDPPPDFRQPGHVIGNCGDAWGKTLAGGLIQGPLTGLTAGNLADVLGADPIYLLGMDCRTADGGVRANWHDMYPWNHDRKARPKLERYKGAKGRWERFHPDFRGRFIVLGESALEGFETASVDDVLPPRR